MELFEDRLRRFVTGNVCEIPSYLLSAIASFVLPEIRTAKDNKLDYIIFLSTHAVIQTVGEKIYGKKGESCTKFYLENFVDQLANDRKFSLISREIHEMRNVLAHQLVSGETHKIAFNYTISEGWKRDSDLLHINPEIYAEEFIGAFETGGRIWNYDRLISADELRLKKYYFLKDYLGLDKKDRITIEVRKLASCVDPSDIERQEAAIKELIICRYGLK